MRAALRALLVALGWAAFLVLWVVALRETGGRALAFAAVVIAVSVLVSGAVATVTVLARRRRSHVVPPASAVRVDRLGRRLLLDEGVRDAQVVLVSIDRERAAKRLARGGRA